MQTTEFPTQVAPEGREGRLFCTRRAPGCLSSILPEGCCSRGNENSFGKRNAFVHSTYENDGHRTIGRHQNSRLMLPDKLCMVPPCIHCELPSSLRGIHPLHHILRIAPNPERKDQRNGPKAVRHHFIALNAQACPSNIWGCNRETRSSNWFSISQIGIPPS